MKTAPEVSVDDIWSTRESRATGSVLGSEPRRNTELSVELSTVVESEWQDVVWLRVQRASTHRAEGWGTDQYTQIILLADEVDALIATLQAVVAEAREKGVLPTITNNTQP